MSDDGPEIDPARAHGGRREVRLTLDVSLSPDSITGTLSAPDGAATPFGSWLGLAQAVASAARSGSGGPIAGPPLLAEGASEPGRAGPGARSQAAVDARAEPASTPVDEQGERQGDPRAGPRRPMTQSEEDHGCSTASSPG